MRVIELKPVTQNNKPTYVVETVAIDKSFDELENISEDLKELSIQRFFVRKSNQTKKVAVGKKI